MVEGREVLVMSDGASLIMRSWHLASELDVWDFLVVYRNQKRTWFYLVVKIYGPKEFIF